MFYFICMFDCNAFLQRMSWDQKDLARRLEIGTSTVGMWCIGKSTPKNKSIEKLLLLGATPTELFGPRKTREMVRVPLSENARRFLPEAREKGLVFRIGPLNTLSR